MNEHQALLLKELNKVATEKVPKEDYQQQVDRWNRYQELLDKVERQCHIQGFIFVRGLRTSYNERRNRIIMAGIAIGMLVSAGVMIYDWFAIGVGPFVSAEELWDDMVYAATTTDPNPTVTEDLIIGNLFWMVTGVMAVPILMSTPNNFIKLPEAIRFECRPFMLVDDLFYVQRYIRGFARLQHDPQVRLPELTMELPQSWIKQQSLIKAMDTMKDI